MGCRYKESRSTIQILRDEWVLLFGRPIIVRMPIYYIWYTLYESDRRKYGKPLAFLINEWTLYQWRKIFEFCKSSMKVQYLLYTKPQKRRIWPTTITSHYTFKYSRVMTEKTCYDWVLRGYIKNGCLPVQLIPSPSYPILQVQL